MFVLLWSKLHTTVQVINYFSEKKRSEKLKHNIRSSSNTFLANITRLQ